MGELLVGVGLACSEGEGEGEGKGKNEGEGEGEGESKGSGVFEVKEKDERAAVRGVVAAQVGHAHAGLLLYSFRSFNLEHFM